MIDGCLEWQRSGLIRPKAVVEATEQYFRENNLVRQWIEERCDTGGRDLRDSLMNLYASWSAWAKDNGEEPGDSRKLADVLRTNGFEGNHTKIGVQFWCIRVRPDAFAPDWVRE
jgi:putative DNA primase/helicase